MKCICQLLMTSALLALPAGAATIDFASQVQPVLETRCLECHHPGKIKGGLQMHTMEAFSKGGEHGAIATAGQPEKSELLRRTALHKGDEDVMPPKSSGLAPEQTALLRQWIAEGMSWPKGLVLRPVNEDERNAGVRLQKKLPRMKSIEILPGQFSLETKRDRHRVVVFARFDDDTTRDVTSISDLKIAAPSIARLDGDTLKPLADGTTELQAICHGLAAQAPVKVTDVGKDRPVSFKLDVMPVFMRAGCNTGGCHGSARGKDGFRISLFGFDPDGDYLRITRENPGRRVNLALPDESTLIEKALGKVPHSGNQCFDEGSFYHHTLLEWITNGAPKDESNIPAVTGIEIYPKQSLMEGRGEKQQVTVRATYSDGTDRDVTDLAVFMTDNDQSASVSKGGLVTSGDKGEAFVLARFSTYSVVSQFIVIPDGLKYERPRLAENNYIDALVDEKLHRLRIFPSATCSDQEFLRRASIDIVGLLPEPEEVRSFIADADLKKRENLVDRLLQKKDFTEMWVMKWAELLQIHSGNGDQGASYKNVLLYYNWLADRIGSNTPMNKIVEELLSSRGGTINTPPANYWQMERETLKINENVAQVFLGMRIQCAQCHNHPFDRWTLNDYYGFEAFFTQIGRKQTDDPREIIIYNNKGGEAKHPVTGASVKPRFLGGAEPEIKPGEDRRAVVARWIASPENPYFARNLANIIWAHFFGIGIIEPVDDMRISNPPSNPALLEALGRKLVEYNYDFRRLVRDICTSQTYQRSSISHESNGQDSRNFSRAAVRRMRAEVLADAISHVTNTPTKYQGLPLGARAVQIADGSVSNYFLTTFGRATRETVCSCEVKMEPTLSQALHFINGEAAHENIKRGKVVAGMVNKDKKSDKEIIDELYLRCFGREPDAAETDMVIRRISESPDGRQAVLEDLFWALLNSKEFYFNH